MAGPEDEFGFSVASMIEDVLMEHGPQLSDVHTTSKSDVKISTKRNEATRWLRKSVGVVAAKDLPAEPSEQNFRMGLRSGLIFCSALNKTEPGAIPKVVGVPSESVIIPDGPPLSTSPYYENIRNFLLAVEERGLPTFEGSDLEQGGRLSRVVNCVLALKAYSEWRRTGGNGTFRYVGNRKPSSKRKEMVCNSLDMAACGTLWKKVKDKPIHTRVRDLLTDQKPQDIPMIVEIVLCKLTEDFEQRLAKHIEKMKPFTNDKEENKSTETQGKEEKKSFSSIMNEMRKKASADINKPSIDINKKIEKNVTTDTLKSTSDINNAIRKNVTSTTDTMKPASDVNKNKEVKATKEAMNSISDDVNNEMEEDADMDSIDDDEMEEDIALDFIGDDVNVEVDDTTMDSGSDDLSDEEEEEASADGEELNGDIYGELEKKKKIERKIELKKKEIEKMIELEKKKEMERETIKEKRREIKMKREMESKKEMEKQAAQDEKEEQYYRWVNSECERLKCSIAKQHRMVEHQHKELQALKNIFSTAKADMQLLRTNYQEELNNLGKHLLNLAQAASGYRKVVDENRKLYNQVQDLKGSIRVYCRVRPAFGTVKKPSCVDCIDETNMAVITPGKGGKDTRKTFTYNRVFGPTATQSLVYVDTQPLIRSVLDGYNVCIFAYGQTGSGKTFTMTGPDVFTTETMGVNYRSLNDLFDIQQQRKNMIAYEVRVQMLEIYNEMVRDLLSSDGANKKYPFYKIRLGTQDGINVPDAALIPVSKTDDVIRLMNLGHKNRAVGSTAMNQRSSRSHSCLTVHVSGKDLTTGSMVRGCMHLVDLAGSERADKTEATGDRLKEATFINKSLSALGDVIASLAQKSTHVPYRNSKLTLLLQDALGGQAKTLMFIHVSPDPDTVGETISTLKFAERVSTVELGAAKSNKDDIDLKQLKEQVAFLKASLAKDGVDIQGNIEVGDGAYYDDGGSSECSEVDSSPQKVANGGAGSNVKKLSQVPGKSSLSKVSPATTPAKKAAAGSSPAAKSGKTSAVDSKKKVGK
ncbi:hypothetical protein E3N88_39978 [Mikania micrantha]|uniref:Kinesin motor domain-containing protein n=1 Tax=Mikania micrantha TaxID=192012 RepID=A0A5N6LM70_9ASTR|nr:hypothetical protein E3N88_39978 [Mikania micrantha]